MRVTVHRVIVGLLVAGLLAGSAAVFGAQNGQDGEAGDTAAARQEQDEEKQKQELSPELKYVLEHVDRANEELEDVKARVSYVREVPLLEEKERSRGTLLFKKPDKIALRLGKPRNEAVYTDGETWWVVSHRAREVEIYEATDDEERSSQETAFLDFGYGRGSEALLEDYSVELVDTEKVEHEDGRDQADDPEVETIYTLKFTPRPKEDRPARYAAVGVVVSDRRWLPHVLVLHESEGEIVHTYALSSIETNTGIKDAAFEYDPPSRYSVRRPQQ